MTDDLLLQIALKAMGDAEALPVLQDAILESGYTDFNVVNLSIKLGYVLPDSVADNYASAVAAFMLFVGWPSSWPLARRCRLPETPAERFESLRRLFDMGYINPTQFVEALDAYSESPKERDSG